MSALAELQAGAVGDEFITVLQRTIRAVGVSRNFPPPEGFTQWDADAVHATASEFLTDGQTPRRLTDLALHCASDQALRARLQGTVRNFLADLGRRTPIGKLVVRINDVLGREPGFVRVEGRWAREPGPVEAGRDDPDGLSRAIRGHDVVVPAWGHDAHRSAPVADRTTVVSLCGVLLDAAGGSLTPRALARAIGHRLGLGQAPMSMDVSALDHPALSDAAGADRTGSDALRLLRAAEVLGQLNDRERLAVARPEYSVRQLAPVLGVSASQSHQVRLRAVTVIQSELVDDDDAEGIALLVMELSRAWADRVDTEARSAVQVAR
ncbi:MAG: hypothetical protein ACR2KK_01130 [Acidimicrobiales bacterium]